MLGYISWSKWLRGSERRRRSYKEISDLGCRENLNLSEFSQEKEEGEPQL